MCLAMDEVHILWRVKCVLLQVGEILTLPNQNERTAKIPTEFKVYHFNCLAVPSAGNAPTFTPGLVYVHLSCVYTYT